MKRLIPLLLFFSVLVACQDQRLVENVGFITAKAFDLSDKEGEYIFTASIPQIEIDADKNRELLRTRATSDKRALQNVSRYSNRELVSGRLQTILYGLEYAEKGIGESIETFTRDPIFSGLVKVIVVNGNAGKLLARDFPEHPRTSKYINLLIEKESQHHLVPELGLNGFMRDWLDDGMDPILPVIKEGEKQVVIDGIGLFQEDTYVGKIDPEDARIFFVLHGNYESGTISIIFHEPGVEQEIELLYNSVRNRRNIHVERDGDNISVTIDVKMIGSILEYNGSKDIGEGENQRFLEEVISEQIEQRGTALVEFMQENNVDSLGIGRYVRNSMSYEEWKDIDWREVFPEVDVTIRVDAKVKDVGFYR